MNPNDETFKTWDNIASIYQEKFMDMDVYNKTYDYICATVSKPKAKLLEIGCGPGNITKYLLAKRPDFDIFGIDIAPNMIALAKQNNPTARFSVMDTRHIGKLTTTYDGIVGGFCLPYLSQKESKELIFSAYKLLNKSGLLYLSFVVGNPADSGFKVGSGGRVYFNFHNLDEIKKQLTEAHFKEIETVGIDYKISENEYDVHTVITAKKK